MSKQTAPRGGMTAGKVIGGFFGFLGRLFATILMVGIITGCIVAAVLTVYILGMVGAEEQIDLDVERLGYSSTMVAYDKDGREVELQKLYLPDNNRIWVDYDDISRHVVEALIAIEDKRFAETEVDENGNLQLIGGHQGVDWRRTFGAFVDMLLPGTVKGGGSTITQQLIKNLTGDKEVRVDRKVREIFRGLDLEKRYTKRQILETYLNVVSFGAGTDGIESAALTYFGKHAKDLDLAEAACIVGITQYPTYYNPRLFPENNKIRQEDVLWEMLQQGKITQKEFDDACDEKLHILSNDVQQAEQQVMSYFEDHVINTVLKDLQEQKDWTASYAFQQLYKGGYKIYTTVDMDMQAYLEEFYLNTDKFPPVRNAEYPQSCATILAPDGRLLAVVGRIGEKVGDRTFNIATMGTRQPGSSLKPLGPYALAFEYDLAYWSMSIVDGPINLVEQGKPDRQWPTNYYSGYHGPMTIARAVQISTNTVAAKLTQTIGPQAIFDFLHDRLNFYSIIDGVIVDGQSKSDVGLAPMALGALTYGVTPLEMAGGYQIYANGGTFTTPYCYTKVEDSNGNVILKADTAPRRVLSEDTAVVMNKLLQTVTTETGATGTTARFASMPTAGKTGTSEHDVNQWFIGMTPYYICQVWLGYEREAYVDEYGNVKPSTILYNSYGPPILWKAIMEPLHEGLEARQFPESEGVVSKAYCTQTGLLATSNCTSVGNGWYKASRLPHSCPGHPKTPDREESGSDGADRGSSESSREEASSIRVPWDPGD